MTTFSVGDVVQLNSCGPDMTVYRTTDENGESNEVACEWFIVTKELKCTSFYRECLTLVRRAGEAVKPEAEPVGPGNWVRLTDESACYYDKPHTARITKQAFDTDAWLLRDTEGTERHWGKAQCIPCDPPAPEPLKVGDEVTFMGQVIPGLKVREAFNKCGIVTINTINSATPYFVSIVAPASHFARAGKAGE